MNKTSSAYALDFESFRENAKKEKKAEKHAKSSMRKAATPEWTKRKGSCVTIMAVVILACLPLVFMLGLMNVKSELNSKISALNTECETLIGEGKMLRSDLDNKASLANAEEYARETLGLAKIQQSQIQHISISSESMTELAPRDNSPQDVIAAAVRSVAAFFDSAAQTLKNI